MKKINTRSYRHHDRMPGQTLKKKKYIFVSIVLICAGFDWLLLWFCTDAFFMLLGDAPYLPAKYAQEYTHLKTLHIPSSMVDEGHQETRITSMAFSPDNKTHVAVDGQNIHFWDVETRNHVSVLKTDQRAGVGVAFSPDGKTVASVSGRSQLPFYMLSMVDALFDPLSEPVGFSVYQQGLFKTYTVEMWDVKTGKKRFSFPVETLLLWAFAFSPDGTKLLLTTYSSFIDVYDPTTGEHLQQRRSILAYNVMRNTYQLNAFAFSPDGKTFASGGRVQARHPTGVADAAIALWDIDTQMPLETLIHPGGRVHLLAFSPDSKILASACGYDFRGWFHPDHPDKIYIWDVENHRLLSVIHTGEIGERSIQALRFAPDNRTLASGHSYGRIHLWDVTAETKIK